MSENVTGQQVDLAQDISTLVSAVRSYLPHPVLRSPDPAKLKRLARVQGEQAVKALLLAWVTKAKDMEVDPLRHQFHPACWKEADELFARCKKRLFIGGGNRAGKTRYCATKMMSLALEKPNQRMLCMHESKASSVSVQQSNIYLMLPPEFKDLKKNRVVNVHYTVKNGFADDIMVLPNGTQFHFRNYTQAVNVIQGDEYDYAWMDECFTLAWYSEVGFRLLTRRGKSLLSVTPIFGYTPALAEVLDGLSVDEWRPSELLPTDINVPGGPEGTMPYKGTAPGGTSAIWFHSDLNPFSPWDEMKLELTGRTAEDVKIRAYGWVDRITVGMFPKFGNVHIANAEEIPEHGTNYLVADPAGSRNWFMLWARVDKDGIIWITREWPDYKAYGEWAIPDKVLLDGKRGPAQTTGAGRGLVGYRKLIRRLEDTWHIGDMQRRFIDPRAGKAATAALKQRSQSLIQTLRTPYRSPETGQIEDEGMHFIAAPGVEIEQGVGLINSLLDFNTEEPLSFYNQPRLRISAVCKNLIWSMTNWNDNEPHDQSASKDPIDALRYMVLMDPRYVDPKRSRATRGGSY